ncbi:MAG: hypothetical protein QOJ07_2399, partial [Thermoleophilaceae bacterium]|nr:hypothetical protein [Thermoleophilaceae bacterium]
MIEKGRKTPELVLLFVLLVLVAVGLAVGGGSTSKKEDRATAQTAKVPSTARVRAIERKVEKIRGLKFKRPIVPRVVTNKQSQQDQ